MLPSLCVCFWLGSRKQLNLCAAHAQRMHSVYNVHVRPLRSCSDRGLWADVPVCDCDLRERFLGSPKSVTASGCCGLQTGCPSTAVGG